MWIWGTDTREVCENRALRFEEGFAHGGCLTFLLFLDDAFPFHHFWLRGGRGGVTHGETCLSQSLGICQYLTVFGLEKDDSTLCCKMKGTCSYRLGHGMQGCGCGGKHASEIMLRPLKWLRRSDVCCAGMAAWVLFPEPSQTKSSCGPALWFMISPREAWTFGSLNHVTDSVAYLVSSRPVRNPVSNMDAN